MSRELDLLHAVTGWCYGDIEALLDFCEGHNLDLNDIEAGEEMNNWFYEAYRLVAVNWLDKLRDYALPTDKFNRYYHKLEYENFHIHCNYMCSCYDNDFLSNYVGSEDYEEALNYLREEKLI